jgi:hypothetical protein
MLFARADASIDGLSVKAPASAANLNVSMLRDTRPSHTFEPFRLRAMPFAKRSRFASMIRAAVKDA